MVLNDKIPLTKQGFEDIQKEYDELVNTKRPRLVERLAESRREGDLSENNEYIQSREELDFLDGRIDELKNVINRAEVIKLTHNGCQQISLGCQVTVQVDGTGENTFTLVGEWEADPMSQKISHESPLGKSLMGKKIGEQVAVEAPVGKIIYTIKKID